MTAQTYLNADLTEKYPPTIGTAATYITDIEECDMGAFNVDDDGTTDPYTGEPNYWKHACNKDCKVTNKNLWNCMWVPDYADADGTTIIGYHSHCGYLRGNRAVDTLNMDGVAMTPPETCDPGVQQWQA